VDESPEGIKAPAPVSAGGESFGFGDFGFSQGDGDFGFGNFGSFEAETDAAPGLPSPSSVKEISAEELVALLEKAAGSGINHSLTGDELIRELEKLLNYRGISYYEIPTDPERYGKTTSEELQRLVANYLVLLSGNISSYSNDPLEPTAVKTTVQFRTLGEADTSRALGEIDRFVKDKFPENVKVTVGGSAMVEASLNRLVVQSQLSSVVISLLLVFLIIAISNRSVAAGIIGIAPLTISILINFAVMGFLGIKLNIGTSMVASVSVGIGIDYTIHYIEAYKREYRASGGTGDFLRRTFATSGKAILINAISVGAGFAVLILSQFNMLKDLGLLIALTMVTSALVSLTVIPVLLLYFKPKFVQGENL
jgi:predicted RND superfamily exporter protein